MVLAFFCVVILVTIGVWRYGYLQALDQLNSQGKADLALASDGLLGQLERYRELSDLLADHPIVLSLSRGDAENDARASFLEVADKTGALNVMFVDLQGRLTMAVGADTQVDMRDIDYIKRGASGGVGLGPRE